MNITDNDLNNYIVKFPTKYDNCLFKKYGISINFPIIFCLKDSMEENLNNISLLTKTILFISLTKPNILIQYSMITFQSFYTPMIFDKKYINSYNIITFGKPEVGFPIKFWNLNVDTNFKLKMYNKIVKHYCELLFLCGQFIPVSDVCIYIVGFLL